MILVVVWFVLWAMAYGREGEETSLYIIDFEMLFLSALRP